MGLTERHDLLILGTQESRHLLMLMAERGRKGGGSEVRERGEERGRECGEGEREEGGRE